MGCNNTKLNSIEGDRLPAKIRPLLRQRIDEFRKRRNVRGEEGDLSKKELLKNAYHHDDDDDGKSQTHSSHKNEVEETEQNVVRLVVPVEKLSKVVPFPLHVNVPECEIEERLKKDKDVEKKPKIPIIVTPQQESKQEEGNPKQDDDHDDDEEDDEDEDDEDEEIGRYIGPGSPSFRIYCIEAEKRKEKEICDANARYNVNNTCHEEEKEQEKEKEKETTPLHNKSLSNDSYESATSASASGNLNEAIEMKAGPLKRRKRHKMKKLKKNLLNVKNIPMNRMIACAGNNDRRRRLLADK